MSRSVRSRFPELLPTAIAVAAIALALSGMTLFRLSGAAQEASPTPAPAITTEVLGAGLPTDIPGKALWLMRVTFAPGAVAASHSHPGSTIFSIESGSIKFTIEQGSVTVSRAGTIGTPTASEQMEAGSETTLGPGDSVFYEGEAVFTEVNEGSEPVVILVANIRDEGAPARVPAATPVSS